NQCQEGDKVTIEETRPISKSKAWKLSSIDRKATIID
ncbi:MAG: 30S ribosomal protein S17, partial [Gammaproteobacteria bacterium]|nr:30S ribosomal protein S17 [Gammaproteobacteria bacterium]